MIEIFASRNTHVNVQFWLDHQWVFVDSGSMIKPGETQHIRVALSHLEAVRLMRNLQVALAGYIAGSECRAAQEKEEEDGAVDRENDERDAHGVSALERCTGRRREGDRAHEAARPPGGDAAL